MKKIFFSLALLGMALYCPAQKIKHHEVAIGWYGGYFFDGASPFQMQRFKKLPKYDWPTISYTYRFNKHIFVMAKHGMNHFSYYNAPFKDVNGIYVPPPPNTLIDRVIRRFNLDVGYHLNLKSVAVRARLGLAYNRGAKGWHILTINQGAWQEPFFEYDTYNDLGGLIGLTIQHPIVWRFFGELSADYLQMFSGIDRQQLIPSYRIGFRF